MSTQASATFATGACVSGIHVVIQRHTLLADFMFLPMGVFGVIFNMDWMSRYIGQGEEGSTSPHHLPKSPTTNREKMRDLSRLHRDHLWTTVLDVCGYIVAQGRGRYKVLAHPCFCEYIGCMLCLCDCFFFFVYITPLVNSGDEISL